MCKAEVRLLLILDIYQVKIKPIGRHAAFIPVHRVDLHSPHFKSHFLLLDP